MMSGGPTGAFFLGPQAAVSSPVIDNVKINRNYSCLFEIWKFHENNLYGPQMWKEQNFAIYGELSASLTVFGQILI